MLLLKHFVTGRPNETIHEESEPEEFWNSIGGQGAYSQCSGRFDKPILEPRLFHCKMIGDTGKMVASEVHNFEKDVRIYEFLEIFVIIKFKQIIISGSSSHRVQIRLDDVNFTKAKLKTNG
jgi:hypothetical protein